MRIGHVSTFPEMRCGIAIYTSDLIEALPDYQHQRFVLHYGENLTVDAAGHCDVRDYRSVEALAHRVNASGVDVVSLQHEFGIWGGTNGEYLFEFLEALRLPLVSTLHTTFPKGSRAAVQLLALRTLIERSHAAFVLTEHSRGTLCGALGIQRDCVHVVPHGVPHIPYAPLPDLRERDDSERWRFCSLGFFRPDKGLEATLQALARMKQNGFTFEYVIAGEPQGQFAEQLNYRDQIARLIKELGLQDDVRLVHRFLSRADQISLIGSSHAGIFAYQDPDQASSGVIPLVLAAGRPVVCTPFQFAVAKAEEGFGVLVAGGFSADNMKHALYELVSLSKDIGPLSADLYRRTRAWSWTSAARAYEEALLLSGSHGGAASQAGAGGRN